MNYDHDMARFSGCRIDSTSLRLDAFWFADERGRFLKPLLGCLTALAVAIPMTAARAESIDPSAT